MWRFFGPRLLHLPPPFSALRCAIDDTDAFREGDSSADATRGGLCAREEAEKEAGIADGSIRFNVEDMGKEVETTGEIAKGEGEGVACTRMVVLYGGGVAYKIGLLK